jgi:hypothetical protein
MFLRKSDTGIVSVENTYRVLSKVGKNIFYTSLLLRTKAEIIIIVVRPLERREYK